MTTQRCDGGLLQGPGYGCAATLGELIGIPDSQIVSALVDRHEEAGFANLKLDAIRAWKASVPELRLFANTMTALSPAASNWGLVLEFDVPRRGKRIDAVLLAEPAIFVLEFKSASGASQASRRQVEDYALELADFHAGARDRQLVPILVPGADDQPLALPEHRVDEQVQDVTVAAFEQLPQAIEAWRDRLPKPSGSSLSLTDWLEASYSPTPTIAEAASHLYANHSVHEIARSEASVANLSRTQDAIANAIQHARTNHRKVACFVTGVPGAGKTLAGLNAVCRAETSGGDQESVFLSGNGPLVKVLGEALARDSKSRAGGTLEAARRKSGKFIQGVHAFIDHHSSRTDPPIDHVAVFDEAQRAWNAQHAYRKFRRPTSEPVAMLRIMDRHPDWAVLVCLVGGGQEINTGEAGLREWGRALENEFKHWKTRVSPLLRNGEDGPIGQSLFTDDEPAGVQVDEALHLSVPVRSYRGPKVADWVDAVLHGDAASARNISQDLGRFEVLLTRSLADARQWLRRSTRGHRRCGVVASSSAKRLRHFGISVDSQVDVAHWFLNPPGDVRSSYYLEQLATEFDIQGLELDRVGVAWDADLKYGGRQWAYHRFVGTAWQCIRKPADQIYLINKYRVLLTRAREGMVIWVPPGDAGDPHSVPTLYDPTAAFLERCGATPL